jgi:hypothetical protein
MKQELRNKIEGWSLQKLHDFMGIENIAPVNATTSSIEEYTDKGLYVYGYNWARFYADNGDIYTLTKFYSDKDWSNYNNIYNQYIKDKEIQWGSAVGVTLPHGSFRMMKPVEHSTLTILGQTNQKWFDIDGLYHYTHLSSPVRQLGTSFLYRLKEAEQKEYYLEYIDQIKYLVDVIESMGMKFPHHALTFSSRLKDGQGWYIHHIKPFTSRKADFLQECLDGLFDRITSGRKMLSGPNNDDVTAILNYAKQRWINVDIPNRPIGDNLTNSVPNDMLASTVKSMEIDADVYVADQKVHSRKGNALRAEHLWRKFLHEDTAYTKVVLHKDGFSADFEKSIFGGAVSLIQDDPFS